MWGVVSDWQQQYSGWKDGRFKDLKVEEMDEAAARVGKTLTKLGRHINALHVWKWII